MANDKKYFLDLGGLQTLWGKMKNTFASKSDLNAVNSQIGTINTNLTALQADIDGVENITLSYAPKTAKNYSEALSYASMAPAGTIIIVGEDEVINDITYNEGFYIVDGDKSIHFIGTSSGIASEDEINELRNRIANIEKEVIKTSSIVDENGNVLGAFTVQNNSLITVYDDTVVANSESVNALTHRAIARKFGEIEALLTNIPKFKIEVVEELPTNSISLSTIYLLKSSEPSNQNLYTEYIYIQDFANGNYWEKLGEQSIALDNYVTKDFLTSTLNNVVTKTDLAIETAKIKAETISEVEAVYAKKTDLNDIATEDSILQSIQSGKIGEAIMITIKDIENLV